MKTANKLAKPIILALGLALMLTCFSGCVGIGNTYANADKYSAGDLDYDAFIDKYGFDWFAVSTNMPMDTYLASNDDYEFVFCNEKDEINIYKKK